MVPRPSFIPPFLFLFTRASLNSHAAPGALGVIPLWKRGWFPGVLHSGISQPGYEFTSTSLVDKGPCERGGVPFGESRLIFPRGRISDSLSFRREL